MKKFFLVISIFIFSMTLGLNEALAAQGGSTAADVDCTGCVDTVDIADGAVTDAKISGPISAVKIADGPDSGLNADMLDGVDSAELQKKYANVVVVAKSGGDFISIQAAIDSLPDPNTTPTLINVMPGSYTEIIEMKSYIHLEGSGPDVTSIDTAMSSGNAITLNNLTNVTISGFTINGHGNGIYNFQSSSTVRGNTIADAYYNALNTGYGIINDGGSMTIIDNKIIQNQWSGIKNFNSASALIKSNTISNNYANGIDNQFAFAEIIDNIISDNVNLYQSNEQGRGISNNRGSCLIRNNKITGNAWGINTSGGPVKILGNEISDNLELGLYLSDVEDSIISHNVITGNINGIDYDYGDVMIAGRPEIITTPNLSFNIYDLITVYNFATLTGSFNVKSDGTSW